MLEIFKLLAKPKKKRDMKEITKEDFDLKLLKGLCEESVSVIRRTLAMPTRHSMSRCMPTRPSKRIKVQNNDT